MARQPADAIILLGGVVTSSAPTPIAWTILVFGLTALILRIAFFSVVARPSERLINYGLAAGIASGMLRERATQDWLSHIGPFSVAFTRQLSTAVMVITFAPLLLLAASWSPQWPKQAVRTSRLVWVSVYTTAVVMLILGSHARALGQYIDRTEGWQTAAYFACFALWLIPPGVLMARASIRELRAGGLRPTHKLTYTAIVIVGIWAIEESLSIFVSSLCAATGTGQWFVEFRFAANENNYIYMLGIAELAAAAAALVEAAQRLRIDPASRAIRQLTPMWRQLVRACPEIPRLTQLEGGVSPSRRLHRMVVEIRDSLSVLSIYAEPLPEGHVTAADEAAQIVGALRRKESGAPTGRYVRLHASALGGGITDLTAETRALRRIAAHWDKVQADVPQPDGEHAE